MRAGYETRFRCFWGSSLLLNLLMVSKLLNLFSVLRKLSCSMSRRRRPHQRLEQKNRDSACRSLFHQQTRGAPDSKVRLLRICVLCVWQVSASFKTEDLWHLLLQSLWSVWQISKHPRQRLRACRQAPWWNSKSTAETQSPSSTAKVPQHPVEELRCQIGTWGILWYRF